MNKKLILIFIMLVSLFIAGCWSSSSNSNNNSSQPQKVFYEPFAEVCDIEKLNLSLSNQDYAICMTASDCDGFCDYRCIQKGTGGQEGSSGIPIYDKFYETTVVSCICKCYKYE